MSSRHLSRHFLGLQAESVASVPFPPAGYEDLGGESSNHNILACCGWSEDSQEYQTSLYGLEVRRKHGCIIETPQLSLLASFQTASRCHALDVEQCSSDSAILVAGSSDGSLYRLRLQIPSLPGSLPSDIRLKEQDFQETELLPFVKPHSSCCTSVSINKGAYTAASVSLDGVLALTALNLQDSVAVPGENIKIHHDAKGAIAMTGCAWSASSWSLFTCTFQGQVQLWDVRSQARPVTLGSSLPIATQRYPLTSLASHPANAHVCVVGSENGMFLEWDVRYPKVPRFQDQVEGGIRCVAYESKGSAEDRVLFCTDVGKIYKRSKNMCEEIYAEASEGFQCMCTSSHGSDSQLFCSTYEEGLVFMSNAQIG
eukprot:jgi/Picsp_1/2102/NSC_05567-R1_nucleoporin 43kda